MKKRFASLFAVSAATLLWCGPSFAINPVEDVNATEAVQNAIQEQTEAAIAGRGESTLNQVEQADQERFRQALNADTLDRQNRMAEALRQENLSDRVKGNEDLELAMEVKNIDLHLGKSLTDMHGNRVRMEEYVMRPATNQVQFLNLTMRDQRLDYMKYLATFNTTVPRNTGGIWNKVFAGRQMPAVYLLGESIDYSNMTDSVVYQVGYFAPAWEGLLQRYVLPEKSADLFVNAIRKVGFARANPQDDVIWTGFIQYDPAHGQYKLPTETGTIDGNLLAKRIKYNFADGTYLQIDDYTIGENGEIREVRWNHIAEDIAYWMNNLSTLVFNSYKEKILTAPEFEGRTIDTVSQFQHLVDVFESKESEGWR